MKIHKILLAVAAMCVIASCGGKKEVMTPEAVVESFCRAVMAGDFDSAREYCDSLNMETYINDYQKVINSLQQKDSSAFAIAAGMLEEAEFEVLGVEKNGEERIVRYRLAAEGAEKAKAATVKKEEGEWKVTAITEAI